MAIHKRNYEFKNQSFIQCTLICIKDLKFVDHIK